MKTLGLKIWKYYFCYTSNILKLCRKLKKIRKKTNKIESKSKSSRNDLLLLVELTQLISLAIVELPEN